MSQSFGFRMSSSLSCSGTKLKEEWLAAVLKLEEYVTKAS